MHIVFCSSEVFPFAKTGGLADVCGSLPQALEKIGIQVSIFMPGYRGIGQTGQKIEQLDHHVSKTTIGSNVSVYFIEHKRYFDREALYGTKDGDYEDNCERYQYFCSQILVLMKQLDMCPDIIHCHDWQTALIPVYLKEKYADDPYYKKIKSILTIHNLAFQGIFKQEEYDLLQLGDKKSIFEKFEYFDKICLLKAGIICSDEVSTVSPQYAKDIQVKSHGCGLEPELSRRKHKVVGILNGIDISQWNPSSDPYIIRQYDSKNFVEAKSKNKIQLQKELFLEVREDIPLFGFIGRITQQKGLDLFIDSLSDLVKLNAQIVVLGVGEERYETAIKNFAAEHPERLACCFEFNEQLGHKIYAGSDWFLMPSEFEPCGLSQMISLRYGTIPIVSKTGGMIDTIRPHSIFNAKANGLMFKQFTKASFLSSILKALDIYSKSELFHRLQRNGFEADFSWEKSAEQYKELYQCMLSV